MAVQPKAVSLLRRFWPTGAGANELTLTLPPGAVLRRVTIHKPAFGTDSALTQYRVGSGDKPSSCSVNGAACSI